jgi:hypothetical protein
MGKRWLNGGFQTLCIVDDWSSLYSTRLAVGGLHKLAEPL